MVAVTVAVLQGVQRAVGACARALTHGILLARLLVSLQLLLHLHQLPRQILKEKPDMKSSSTIKYGQESLQTLPGQAPASDPETQTGHEDFMYNQEKMIKRVYRLHQDKLPRQILKHKPDMKSSSTIKKK